MSRPVKQRRNIVISNDSVTIGVNSFSFYLYVPFQPDEVILRTVSVGNDQLANYDIISVSSDLIDSYNNILFSVSNANANNTINTSYTISQPINRTFTFNIHYLHEATTLVQNCINFMLEFVSYESRDDFDSSKNEVLKLKSKY
jgi:hypothetical protein